MIFQLLQEVNPSPRRQIRNWDGSGKCKWGNWRKEKKLTNENWTNWNPSPHRQIQTGMVVASTDGEIEEKKWRKKLWKNWRIRKVHLLADKYETGMGAASADREIEKGKHGWNLTEELDRRGHSWLLDHMRSCDHLGLLGINRREEWSTAICERRN